MKCPVCNETLTMSERQGVEIDFCPKCRGVWLDRGELDKILEREASYAQGPPQQMPQNDPRYGSRHRHDDDDDDDRYRYGKRKKSIWHELFD
jgi:Zn-finger nucleic acid-binding protein